MEKKVLVLLIALAGFAFTTPNLFDKDTVAGWPDFLPNQQINLGLDLQGGSHLLVEVDTAGLVRERLEVVVDDARQALRDARIRYTGLGVDNGAAVVTIADPADRERALELTRDLASPLTSGLLGAASGQLDLTAEIDADGRIRMEMTPEATTQRRVLAVEQSIEIIRRRIDELGTREPTIQRQGDDRIVVQVPGADNPQRIKDIIGQTAKLTFHLLDASVSPQEARGGRLPPGSMLLPSDEGPEEFVVRRRSILSGDNLVDAQPGSDSRTGEAVVNFRFDAAGGKRFADATTQNVGRPFAIVLDGKVLSAPVIREPILGGSGQISGSFTFETANDLAVLLRAGALPTDLTFVEERTVGPDLGADSVAAGKMAAIVGLLAVLVFMAVYYGFMGLIADVALVVNIVLLMGVLSLLQATLTLPGIAGIVLTIGMAVDANVLIFERIREELKSGKSRINAVETGYSRALTTILDANITTLIATLILFGLGSGPVKGFAVTLSIGVITSVFTAFTFSRLLVSLWIRSGRGRGQPPARSPTGKPVVSKPNLGKPA